MARKTKQNKRHRIQNICLLMSLRHILNLLTMLLLDSYHLLYVKQYLNIKIWDSLVFNFSIQPLTPIYRGMRVNESTHATNKS